MNHLNLFIFEYYREYLLCIACNHTFKLWAVPSCDAKIRRFIVCKTGDARRWEGQHTHTKYLTTIQISGLLLISNRLKRRVSLWLYQYFANSKRNNGKTNCPGRAGGHLEILLFSVEKITTQINRYMCSRYIHHII